MSLTFGISSKRRPTLIFANFIFNRYKENKTGRIVWRCQHFQKHGCRSQIITHENQIMDDSRLQHTHPASSSLNIIQKHGNGACDTDAQKVEKKQDKRSSTKFGGDLRVPRELKRFYDELSPLPKESSPPSFNKSWKVNHEMGNFDDALSPPTSLEDSEDTSIDEHCQPGRRVPYTSSGKNEDFIAQYNDAVKSLAKFCKNVKSNERRSTTDDEDDSVRYTIKTVSKCQSKQSRGGKHLRGKWICY